MEKRIPLLDDYGKSQLFRRQDKLRHPTLELQADREVCLPAHINQPAQGITPFLRNIWRTRQWRLPAQIWRKKVAGATTHGRQIRERLSEVTVFVDGASERVEADGTRHSHAL